MKRIKNLVKSAIRSLVTIFSQSGVGRFVLEQILNTAMSRNRSLSHNGTQLNFVVPNGINNFRVDTFSTKEPETLEWIDQIPFGSNLWDIGANVGLYSCYAAKARNCKVYAFEPSVFNLELLARNVFLNKLVDKVMILPLPLSEKSENSNLNMTTTEWGGALSTFGQDYTHDGKKLKQVFQFQTFGISMTDAVNLLKLPKPDFIKMDVDGIEHLILKGGLDVLRSVKGVIIEINEEFEKQSLDSKDYLSSAGLVLKEKRHSEMFDGTICYNQIWTRTTEFNNNQ